MKAIQYEQGEAALNAVVQAIQDLVKSGVIAFRREERPQCPALKRDNRAS